MSDNHPKTIRLAIASEGVDTNGNVPYLYSDVPADYPDHVKDTIRESLRKQFAHTFPGLPAQESEIEL